MSKHLSSEVRSQVRLFAFFVGNASMLDDLYDDDFDALAYSSLFTRRDNTLGDLFAIYLNVLAADTEGNLRPHGAERAGERAQQWLRHAYDPRYTIEPPVEAWELFPDTTDVPWKQPIKNFARDLGRGAVAPDLLAGIDLLPYLTDGGTWLERLFAIFTNVLLIDGDGHALNAAWAARRAVSYIRCVDDPTYGLDRPFEQWELELW